MKIEDALKPHGLKHEIIQFMNKKTNEVFKADELSKIFKITEQGIRSMELSKLKINKHVWFGCDKALSEFKKQMEVK